MEGRARRLQVGDRLPRTSLPARGGGRSVPLRDPHRRSTVLVFVHDPEDPGLRELVSALARRADRLSVFGSRLVVIANEESAAASAAAESYPIVSDKEGSIRERFGWSERESMMVIADRWGEVHHVVAADSAAGLPSPEDVEEWVSYLASRCPECGVLDDAVLGWDSAR